MKIILPLLIALCLIASKVRSQIPSCPLDTIASGVHYLDTLDCDTADCLPWPCGTESHSRCYQVPAYMEGVTELGAYPHGYYNVKFVTENDSVKLDTCLYLVDFAGGGVRFFWKYGPNAQIIISGPEGANIFFVIKPDTTQPHKELPPTQYRIDPLCNATAIDPAMLPLMDGIYREIYPPYREVLYPEHGVIYCRNRKLVTVF